MKKEKTLYTLSDQSATLPPRGHIMITIAVTLAELYAAPGNSARSAKRVSGKAPFLWALRRRERASRHSSAFVCLCAKLAFQLGTRCRGHVDGVRAMQRSGASSGCTRARARADANVMKSSVVSGWRMLARTWQNAI